MAPVVRALQEDDCFDVSVVVTAQHRQMLDQVLELFEITPDVDLDLMTPNQSLAELTSRVVTGLVQVFERLDPDCVLVHGDTTTTFAGALAAYYCRVPVGHVEAGLRTYDPYAPWPEEMNRQLAGRIARWHFAPTAQAAQNLRSEGVEKARIVQTGNTVIDALMHVSSLLEAKLEEGALDMPALFGQCAEPSRLTPDLFSALDRVSSGQSPMVLVTGHRRENLDGGLDAVCTALARVARARPELVLVYPVHLNPRVGSTVERHLAAIPNVHLIPPLDYLPFVHLMKLSRLVVTDSGGIQEEAPALGKPVLVTRDVTERPEAIEAGTCRLVGTDADTIERAVVQLLDDDETYATMSRASNPFGDGHASERIVEFLRSQP